MPETVTIGRGVYALKIIYNSQDERDQKLLEALQMLQKEEIELKKTLDRLATSNEYLFCLPIFTHASEKHNDIKYRISILKVMTQNIKPKISSESLEPPPELVYERSDPPYPEEEEEISSPPIAAPIPVPKRFQSLLENMVF